MRFRWILTGAALSLAISGPALAEEDQCEPRGTNGMVTLVLCPPGLDEAALVAAGEAACGERRPCGAWIWDDVANIPSEVPERHDLLSKDAVATALAIWVNEKAQLVRISKTSN